MTQNIFKRTRASHSLLVIAFLTLTWSCNNNSSAAQKPGMGKPDFAAGETIYRDFCIACHTIDAEPRRAPDLKGLKDRRPKGWPRRFLDDPIGMVATDPIAKELKAEWSIQMPDPELSFDDQRAVLGFIERQGKIGPVVPQPPIELTDEAFDKAKSDYFNLCAGCHGTLRAGATGPAIGEAESKALGTDVIMATLRHGLPTGMPAFGKQGLLDEDQIAALAAFLQMPPPEAPPFTFAEIEDSWKLITPVAARPSAPQHSRDWENFVGVVLRDASEIAIIDGDTKEELARIETGFAVHILRTSASGRYFYAIGRDGHLSLIDLWAAKPALVAEVRGCWDARSVESSRHADYVDKYVIEGCYWPPQYVVYDGLTLQPLTRVDVPLDTFDTGEKLKEVRVASMVGSGFAPIWLLSLKETGYIGIVDYSQPGHPLVQRIGAERFLHDGGWDHTKRYFLVAANQKNKMVVIDAQTRKLAAKFTTGEIPHPGRGANWIDPVYGWVNATPHLGEGKLTIYGADPVTHPAHAWKTVREIELPSPGSLFIKTHDNSPFVFVDFAASNDTEQARKICAYSKQKATLEKCWSAAAQGRVTHFEFNKAGTEVWVSAWDKEEGALVIYDAKTLTELRRIKGLESPTGKFNVYNTANDIY